MALRLIEASNIPDRVKIESKPCPLGCEPDDEFLFFGRDRLFDLPGNYPIVRCRHCDLIRTDPRPTPDTIGLYYPENYGPYIHTKITSRAHKIRKPKRGKEIIKKILNLNLSRIPPLPPGRMLELGCASGKFLHTMAGFGWDVAGIEFSASAAEEARSPGYRVHTGDITTAPTPDELYDLVVGWAVIEHLHYPLQTLEILLQWTKPGGWLAISVPNTASIDFRLFKECWYALHIPAHLFHFTPVTLQNIFSRSGWRLEKIYHQRVLSNYWASIGYKLNDRGIKNRFTDFLIRLTDAPAAFHYAMFPLALVFSFLGQTGRMTVWARKPEH